MLQEIIKTWKEALKLIEDAEKKIFSWAYKWGHKGIDRDCERELSEIFGGEE